MHLTLLHFNDLHGRLDRLPQLFSLIDRARQMSERSLLINTGDTCDRACAECDLTQGRAGLALLNAMGVDVGVPGNHDADWGPTAFTRWVTSTHFPMLGANLEVPGLQGRHVLALKGLKIGLVGVVTDLFANVGLTWRDPIATTQQAVTALRAEGADIVIVLSHLGYAWAPEHNDFMAPDAVTDVILADRVAGIDLIVGGHTHTPLPAPVRHGATWIVQASPLADSLGVVELQVSPGALSVVGGLLPLEPDTPVDPTISSVVELVREEVRAMRG
jgi:2',3'-cyclic-nucleotide 2'-phosphodiesterase (5'-nucleotidase family)